MPVPSGPRPTLSPSPAPPQPSPLQNHTPAPRLPIPKSHTCTLQVHIICASELKKRLDKVGHDVKSGVVSKKKSLNKVGVGRRWCLWPMRVLVAMLVVVVVVAMVVVGG